MQEAKRSIRVATGLLWKPFDVRFEDVLENFRFHKDLVNSELLLAQLLETRDGKANIASQIQALQEALRKREEQFAARDAQSLSPQAADMKKNIMDRKVAEIKFWIKTPHFDQPYERALDQKEPGTAEWLLSQQVAMDWLNRHGQGLPDPKRRKFDEQAFWVQASTVAEFKTTQITSSQSPQVFYFFFQDGLPEFQDSSAPLRAFLAQMFHIKRTDEDVIDRFSFIMDETSSGSPVASRGALLELLQLCIGYSESAIFVIDGLDECEDPEAFTKDLLALSNESNRIKLLLFSRPNVSALFKTVPDKQHLNIGNLNKADIEALVRSQLDEMDEEEMFPATVDITELGDRMIFGASGMFLWVRLMVAYLNSPALTRRQRSEAIMNITTPEGLEQMYDRIVVLIKGKNSAERDLASRIFIWLLHSKRPLTTQELQVAISDDSSLQSGVDDDYVDFKRSVIMSCAGLVEVQTTSSDTFAADIRSFQFIHLSAKEYILDQHVGDAENTSHGKRSMSITATGHGASLAQIATRCLAVLCYRLPADPLSGSLDSNITPTEIHKMFPFVGYAACHWIDHCLDDLRSNRDADTILAPMFPMLDTFMSLKRHLMAWIEASYAFRRIPSASKLEEVSRTISSLIVEDGPKNDLLEKLVRDTTELARYANILENDWGRQLLQSPIDVWEEITAFTTSRLVEGTRHTQVHTLIMDPPKAESIGSRYLSKISELSEDGKTVAILSIWPSK
ncbi:uncharacterized protein N0V89_003660 [Didymosphaeria variabile]|uniref:NACHT domain-containing protein n=1 Tax=Didymosphaeria variabile TaxID=1932322 RepID=A0A9W8XQZ1_9PLEO|nr:uncharacterized protein N0V89_003660 [Didymosphaeria variabile]KAJ4355640.1 hypothetical protein N0V89_003660 [Didymosphaeria variabile]